MNIIIIWSKYNCKKKPQITYTDQFSNNSNQICMFLLTDMQNQYFNTLHVLETLNIYVHYSLICTLYAMLPNSWSTQHKFSKLLSYIFIYFANPFIVSYLQGLFAIILTFLYPFIFCEALYRFIFCRDLYPFLFPFLFHRPYHFLFSFFIL